MVTHVKYPNRRYDMLYQIKKLSNFEMQKKEWVDPKFKYAFYGNMCFPADVLLDELNMDEWQPGEDCLGYTLKNEQEGHLIHKVSSLLMRVIKEIGIEKPDTVYLTSPLWQEVVQAAKEAYDYIMTYEDMDDLLRQCREE